MHATGEISIALATFVLVTLLVVGIVAAITTAPISDAVAAVISPLITAAAAWLYPRLADRLSGPLQGTRLLPQSWRVTAITCTLGLAVLLAGSLVLNGLLAWFGVQVEEQARLVALTKDPGSLALLILAAVVMAPVAEEWFFRQAFFGRLRQRISPNLAALVAAVFFALIHQNWPGLPIYLWIGLVCTWVYVRSGRLGSAIFVHTANNAISLLHLLYQDLL